MSCYSGDLDATSAVIMDELRVIAMCRRISRLQPLAYNQGLTPVPPPQSQEVGVCDRSDPRACAPELLRIRPGKVLLYLTLVLIGVAFAFDLQTRTASVDSNARSASFSVATAELGEMRFASAAEIPSPARTTALVSPARSSARNGSKTSNPNERGWMPLLNKS